MHNDFFSTSTKLKWSAPLIWEVANESDLEKVTNFASEHGVVNFFDPMASAIDELYDIEFPSQKDLPIEEKSSFETFKSQYEWPVGVFAYFPWSKTLLRLPNKKNLRALRTSRNRNLITAEEQAKLYSSTIFIAGLSVGSNIAEALVSMGIGSRFICADMDTIDPSNLNRIRAPYYHVGMKKTDSVALRMSEIDPYLDFVLVDEGITAKNLTKILDEYNPTVVIDEMDQVQLKIIMRKEAKARSIPVVSAADNGDSALLDVERYDIDSEYPIFHGLIPEDVLNFLETSTDIPRQQLGLLIGKYFVGPENIPLRMYQSLTEVGKTLPSWPQLGGAATQSGVAVAYACRQIILGKPLRAGRFVVGPDQVLNPEIDNQKYQDELSDYRNKLASFEL